MISVQQVGAILKHYLITLKHLIVKMMANGIVADHAFTVSLEKLQSMIIHVARSGMNVHGTLDSMERFEINGKIVVMFQLIEWKLHKFEAMIMSLCPSQCMIVTSFKLSMEWMLSLH